MRPAIRRFREDDRPVVWTLSQIPHIGATVEQPEAVAFYRALGYSETRREKHPDWELVFFTKDVTAPSGVSGGHQR